MSRLTRMGIIKRKDRKYSLTFFGKIVYDAETMIEDAVRNYEKLKIIETLEDFSTPIRQQNKRLRSSLTH